MTAGLFATVVARLNAMSRSLDNSIQSESDVELLLGEMTLAEKAGQLNQPPNLDSIEYEDIRQGRLGSVICSYTAFAGNEKHTRVRVDLVNRLQRVAVEESRLGIPLIFARDVIHGYRTIAPIPLGMAASFSPDHVRAVYSVAAMEAAADGIRWAFAPMLDIGRDPRWGRVAEGFGEDPYLTSVLGAAAVEGLQGSEMTVAACMKHFAGYGAAEGGRDYNSGEITEHTYRNVILRPFHAAVKAGVATAMAAFLEVGGEVATSNPWLLRTILKKEWGFDGVVVSDWNAVHEIVEHGRAENDKDASRLALMAGNDVDMASFAYIEHIPALVQGGLVPLSVLDEALRRILLLKYRLGLFRNPYTDPGETEAKQFTPKSQETTLELARRSIVLAKNGGLLPLEDQTKVLLFGSLAQAQVELFGTWTLDGVSDDVVTISEALKKLLPESTTLIETSLPDEAVSYARLCSACVAVVGESPHRSGENNSVSDIGLPPGQVEQLRALKRIGVPLVVVVLTGRALDLSDVAELADSLLIVFHPGVMGGIAVAETLTGVNNPSGKLPMTFPRSVGQIPIYYARRSTGRPTEPLLQDESRLIDSSDSPLFPFGFGMSYSRIEYLIPELSGWTVSIPIRVKGARDAEDVVQMYLRDEVACRVRPVRELIRFKRVIIAAGNTELVQFELTKDDFGYYGEGGKWVVEPGWFTLFVGADCAGFARVRLDSNGEIVETIKTAGLGPLASKPTT